MTDKKDEIEVNFGVDVNFIKNVSVRDITPLECIFDLIDNSIDAAREIITSSPDYKPDELYGLPASYSGFEVEIFLSKSKISITDNCKGLSREDISNSAFITGKESNAPFAIGHFGIGLKRALLKLGKSYEIISSNDEESYRFSFLSEDIGGGGKNKVKTSIEEPLARRGFEISINELNEDSQGVANDSEWLDKAKTQIGQRYGLFLQKGLKITVNRAKIKSLTPKLRKKGPISPTHEDINSATGVKVHIDTGTHWDYRLTNETGYKKNGHQGNDDLTEQYGWYFVCNDRVMIVADHSKRLGWQATWHSDYYGFVGWVHFVSEDVEKLPWDTKKTDISVESAVFLDIKDQLQSYANEWKRKNNKVRPRTKTGTSNVTIDSDQTEDENQGSGSTTDLFGAAPSANGGTDKPQKPQGTEDNKPNPQAHNEYWDCLLPNRISNISIPKLSALIHECNQLPLSYPYAGTMLLRSTVEALILGYIKKMGNYNAVREMVFEEQEKASRPFTDEQKVNYRLGLDPAIRWLRGNIEIFPAEHRRECKHSLDVLGKHIKEMNGVVHEGNLIRSDKLKIMRDDIYHLISTLCEYFEELGVTAT